MKKFTIQEKFKIYYFFNLEAGSSESKPQCKKAKERRLERKKQKLESKGVSFEEFIKTKKENQQQKNQEKSLKDYINDIPENGCHKLKVFFFLSKSSNHQFSFMTVVLLQYFNSFKIVKV